MYLMASAVWSCGFTWTCVLTTSAGWVMREANTPARTPQLKLATGATGDVLISKRKISQHVYLNEHQEEFQTRIFLVLKLVNVSLSYLYLWAVRLWSGCRTWRRSRRKERLWGEWPWGRRTEPQDLQFGTRCAEPLSHSRNCTCHTETQRRPVQFMHKTAQYECTAKVKARCTGQTIISMK